MAKGLETKLDSVLVEEILAHIRGTPNITREEKKIARAARREHYLPLAIMDYDPLERKERKQPKADRSWLVKHIEELRFGADSEAMPAIVYVVTLPISRAWTEFAEQRELKDGPAALAPRALPHGYLLSKDELN